MRLRSRLFALTLATLLPMVIFGVGATALIARRERDVFRRGAQERTLALLTALDIELSGHVTSLRGLASSRNLESGGLRAFYDEATRTLPTQANWRSISLARPSGQRLFRTADPYDAEPSPVLDQRSFEKAVRTGRPTIGNLVTEGSHHGFSVRLPVLHEGEVKYVLSVMIDPGAVLALLSPQRLPVDWVGVVLDANDRIVARTVDHAARVGQPSSDSLRAALARGSEGWFLGSTIEGTQVYTPFNRSSYSGWTVAMGIPTSAVEAAASNAAWMLALGTSGAVATALLLAVALSRRITAPIVSLAAAARDLGTGTPIAAPAAGGVREVDDVRLALASASNAIREREEALRTADRAKDEFLAMLGHELRNPLGALSSAAALLKLGRPEDGPSRAAIPVIDRQVQHMTRLVDDLLDVGRATSGKIQLARGPLNLADLVPAVVRVMQSSRRLDDHEVAVDASPVWVEADDARAEQIVSNLVGNAAKYTPAGGRIAVRVFRRDGDAVVQVEDTGVGLSPELVPRVFDLFVQGERSLDRSSGGLGIGLTLVKRLVELHGGQVTALSDGPGRGSRFTVVLPAIEAPAAEAPALADRRPGTLRCRILLVEDNDDAREMMRAALEAYGHHVFEASDGPGGIRAAADTDPDVVVIDVGLPGLDGYDVARLFRATPERAGTCLIALTGYGQPEARQHALDAGFDEHLTKPVAPERLAGLTRATDPGRRWDPRGLRLGTGLRVRTARTARRGRSAAAPARRPATAPGAAT